MPVSFDSEVYAYKEAISSTIDYNNGTITEAKLTATISATGEYVALFWLSANGGTNWEQVTNRVSHTFTNTGTDLRYKIGGSGPFDITHLEVEIIH
jgi:hypothetical protein